MGLMGAARLADLGPDQLFRIARQDLSVGETDNTLAKGPFQ